MYTLAAQGALQGHRASKQKKDFSLENYVEDHLRPYHTYFTIPLTIEAMKAVHATLFTQQFNLRDATFFYTITNPALTGTRINQVCRKNSIFRDTHIVANIHELLSRGKNIFVVFGSTHAVMQEKALRSLDLNPHAVTA